MYLKDFFKRFTSKSNIPVAIYMVLNVFIIAVIISYVFSGGYTPLWKACLYAIALYAVSLAVALSPVGEMILRLQTGCRKIRDEKQRDFIEPIFNEVYAKARTIDPSIPGDVQIYINDDEEPNAFATGRKTVCITKGMLNMPVNQIKATLAHEFGHLAHKDTDLILLVSVGNLIVSAFIIAIRLLIDFVHIVLGLCTLFLGGPDGVVASIANALYHVAISLAVTGLTWLWTKIGVFLVMKSSRDKEYEADEFSFNLGYGDALCELLNSIGGTKSKGLFANLSSSHPDNKKRIARLQSLKASVCSQSF